MTADIKIRDAANILGMIGVAVIVYVMLYYVELVGLRANIDTGAYNIEDWLQKFKEWSTIIIAVSLITSMTWYIWLKWFTKCNDWMKSDKRTLWYALFIPVVGFIIAAIVITREPIQANGWIAYLLYGLNGIISFYLSTAFFSPPAFKYAPLFSEKIRRLQ